MRSRCGLFKIGAVVFVAFVVGMLIALMCNVSSMRRIQGDMTREISELRWKLSQGHNQQEPMRGRDAEDATVTGKCGPQDNGQDGHNGYHGHHGRHRPQRDAQIARDHPRSEVNGAGIVQKDGDKHIVAQEEYELAIVIRGEDATANAGVPAIHNRPNVAAQEDPKLVLTFYLAYFHEKIKLNDGGITS